MGYLDILYLLRKIAKKGSLPELKGFYKKHVFGKNFRFVDWDVMLVVNKALTGFIDNDFKTHKVFILFLFDVLAGYGDTICSVCRNSHKVFEKFPKVAEFILPYANLAYPDARPSKMVTKLRGYPG